MPRANGSRCTFLLGLSLFSLFLLAMPAAGQTGSTGNIAITIVDPSGAVVPAAQLELRDATTNLSHRGVAGSSGEFTFPSLPFGTYTLTVTAQGFQKEVFQSVRVQTAQTTTIRAELKVGTTQETVTVTSESVPLIQTESSTLADTVDTKQVAELPVNGRNVFGFALLVPGWATQGSTTGGTIPNGTWNNMPGGAIQSADYDGTAANANRFRSSGFTYGTSAVQPRIENIAEMTISTAQLDLSGTGSAAMRINMVTRRGSNAFHGRVFEDFRNNDLNANSWFNNDHNTAVPILKLNDFGFSVGGPILKNKLFFFGTFAKSIQPATNVVTQSVLSPSAAAGNFAYTNTSGQLTNVNVLTLGGSGGATSAINSTVASQLQAMVGSYNQGSITATSDPNINTFVFQAPYRTTTYYPALRFDYNMSERLHFGVNYSQTKSYNNNVNTPNFPGVDTIDYSSNFSNNKNVGFNADYTFKPTLINQFHAGYLYQYSLFDSENLGVDLTKIQIVNFSYGAGPYGGAYLRQPISSLYPLFNINDSLNWQKGNHQIVIGGGWQNEHDHYWNGPGGYPAYNLGAAGVGFATGDPLGATFISGLTKATTTQLANAENLYSELTGRVSSVSIAGGGRPLDASTGQYKPFGSYNLDETMSTGHVYIQDRWRFRPNLTVNFGLRWDFVGDDWDVNGGYSSATSLGDFWGPTPVGALFQPGKLGGVANPTFTARTHVYNPSWVNPQPALAIAWSPKTEGFLAKLFPKDKTVIRTGWSLRNYQEGQQNFWAWGSNAGLFFFQQGSLNADASGAAGTFKPGTLFLGQTLPAYNLSPAAWSPTIQASQLSFGNNSFYGMNTNIRIPYVEQWNFGIQREIGQGSVLEVRYAGNMSMHSWMSYNLNEVNVVENGFLSEFQHAQANLAVNQANGKGNTFAYNSLTGQFPLPIFSAMFGTATSNYTSGTFITPLQTGAAGSLAQTVARNVTFFCNMVGAAFSPCASRGFTNAGAYPVNFFEANPFTTGFSDNYLDASGHSNYHALQVELRQRAFHGLQVNANYTLGKSMVLGPVNAYQANTGAAAGGLQGLYWTDRNYRLNYTPSGFDIRHIVHLSGTYDLPFGKGKKFLNGNSRFVNSVAGGWTLGTILVMQSGNPTQMSGGYLTFNQNDSGVIFGNGLTASQLQNNVGVYHTGNPWIYTVNPSLINTVESKGNGTVIQSDISAANIAGQLGYRPIIYGPHWFNDDLSLNKYIPIRESIRASLQFQFLNVTNHPTFNLGSLSPQSTAFAQSTSGPTGGTSTARRLEFRLNVEF
jgi:hypothetical protein